MGRATMWRHVQVAPPILLSAGAYLFGYVTNIAIIVKYYQHSSDPSYSMLFFSMLTLLLAAHLFNALSFLIKFPRPSSAALRAAYFLPLFNCIGLLHRAWTSGSLDTFQESRVFNNFMCCAMRDIK